MPLLDELYYQKEIVRLELLNNYLVNALKEISEIEDEYNCGDWDEIEKAREIAFKALEVSK